MSYAIDDATPEPDNHLVRPVAVFVTLLLLAWNVAGWLLDKGVTIEGAFVAAMTGAFLALSLNASAQMRRAKDKRHHDAQTFWTGVLYMCSAWSAYSAHHGYGVIVAGDVAWGWTVEAAMAALSAAPALVILTAAAFIEPFLLWAIERTEAPARPLEAANDREPGPARKRGFWSALGLGVGLIAAPPVAAAQPAPAPQAEPVTTSLPRHSEVSRPVPRSTHRPSPARRPTSSARGYSAEDETRARQMLADGATPYAVSRATPVPLSTLKGWRARA